MGFMSSLVKGGVFPRVRVNDPKGGHGMTGGGKGRAEVRRVPDPPPPRPGGVRAWEGRDLNHFGGWMAG